MMKPPPAHGICVEVIHGVIRIEGEAVVRPSANKHRAEMFLPCKEGERS